MRCGAPDRARTGRSCGATLGYAMSANESVSITADRSGLRPVRLMRDMSRGPWGYRDILVCPRCGANHALPDHEGDRRLAELVTRAQGSKQAMYVGQPNYGVR